MMKLFERLLIVSEVSDGEYLMPCVLKTVKLCPTATQSQAPSHSLPWSSTSKEGLQDSESSVPPSAT